MRIIAVVVGLFMLMAAQDVQAQKQWTLNDCILYALANNIQIKQTGIQIEQGEIELNTAKNSRLPSLNAGLSGSGNFGQSMNRYGVYQDQSSSSAGVNVNLAMPIYQGSRINHQIEAAKLDLEATSAQFSSAVEDLSLNIASRYVEVLYNKQMLIVAENQSAISNDLVERSKIQMESGKVSKSDYYEAMSVAANDRYGVTNAKNNLELSLLTLSQLLNLPASEPFDVAEPAIGEVEAMASVRLTDPTSVFSYAVKYRPSVIQQELRLKSFEKNLAIAKSAYLPTISLSAGYSNSYYYSFSDDALNSAFNDQFKQNGRESVGISVSIPIFNRFQTRNNVSLSNLNIRNQSLVVEDTKRKLQEEIERAYLNAQTSQDNFIASKEAFDAAEIAFEFEQEKSNAGRSTIFDFNDSKNRLIRAESDMARAKYQFMFNKKILDFYNGKPITE